MKRIFLALLTASFAVTITAMDSDTHIWGTQGYSKALRRVENGFEAGNLTAADVAIALGQNSLAPDGRSSFFNASEALGVSRKISQAVLTQAGRIVQLGASATPQQKENVRAALIFIKSNVANVHDHDVSVQAEGLLRQLS